MDFEVLIVEGEEWVDEEESSDEKVKKDVHLMAFTDEFVSDDASSSSSTFEACLSKSSSDSKVENLDSSSLYHV